MHLENGWLPRLSAGSRDYELLHMPSGVPYLATCRRSKVLMAVLAIESYVSAKRPRQAVVPAPPTQGRENGWLPHLTLSSRIYEPLHMPKRIPYLATCRRFKVLMAVLAIGSDVSAKRPRQAVVPAASSQGRWTDGSFRSGTQWLSLALTHITYNIHTYPHTNGLITTRPRYIPKQSSAHSVQVALLD